MAISSSGKRISITDIATRLHLSPSTVSRALSGYVNISDATRTLVQQTARELNYRPNQLAAALRKGRSQTIGVIVPHLNGYFFPAVLNGVERRATKAGFTVVICQSNEDGRRERQHIETLLAAQVEEIIVSISSSTQELDHFQQVQSQGTPLVFFDRTPALPGSTAVVLDDFLGAYQVVEHLLAQGCRRIAHFAGPQHLNTSQHRYLGYQAALRAHDVAFGQDLVYELPTNTLAAGRQGMQLLLQQAAPPDAVFAAYAFPAAGALEVLKAHGLRVPQNIALACFSNEPFTSLLEPALTAVDQCAEQMGETAVQLFLQVLQHGPAYPMARVILKPELLVRASSQYGQLHPATLTEAK